MIDKLLLRLLKEHGLKDAFMRNVGKSAFKHFDVDDKATNYSDLQTVWKWLKPSEKDILRRYFMRDYEGTELLKELEDRVSSILDEIDIVGFNNLSSNQKKTINTYGDLVSFDKQTTKYMIKSSWLRLARYDKKSKTLRVSMVRGRAEYVFLNVPQYRWLALRMGARRKGAIWWTENYWRYSTGKYANNPPPKQRKKKNDGN